MVKYWIINGSDSWKLSKIENPSDPPIGAVGLLLWGSDGWTYRPRLDHFGEVIEPQPTDDEIVCLIGG